MSIPLTDEQATAIAEALAQGLKIEAIKLYREATGAGLKEAKDFVDALVPKLLEEDPQKYAKLAGGEGGGGDGGGGCASLLLLVFALVVGVTVSLAG